MATTWVLTGDLGGLTVEQVPTRKNDRPDWVMLERRRLGLRISDLRAQREWSQDRLAERSGLERRSIQRYEAGTRDPQYSDLLLIAASFGVHVRDLLG